MRRQGERLRTPNEAREILRKRSAVGVDTIIVTAPDLSPTLAAQVRHLNWRVKQARALLSGSNSEMLISELRRHAASWRAIQEANLN